MKWTKFAALVGFVFILTAGLAQAGVGADEPYREQTASAKMLHKLGRGITNVFTCWVEVPRNIASEWQKTDPVTGFFMGTVEGLGWGFARFATGVYDTCTFPFPIPADYQAMMEPEFVITDIWGDPVPDLTEFSSNDPKYPTKAPIYPDRFSF